MVIDKLEYVKKVINMLNDKETYEVLKEDPAKRTQDKMNKLLKRYKEQGQLSKKM